jgi:hypothetical protein
MLLLTILVVLLIAVDIVFYILATGKFARIDTRVRLLKGDTKTSFTSIHERLTTGESRIGTLEDLQEQMGKDVGFLAGNISDVKEEVGDIKGDFLALQRNAANNKEPITTALPATTVAKNGRRSTAKREVK